MICVQRTCADLSLSFKEMTADTTFLKLTGHCTDLYRDNVKVTPILDFINAPYDLGKILEMFV